MTELVALVLVSTKMSVVLLLASLLLVLLPTLAKPLHVGRTLTTLVVVRVGCMLLLPCSCFQPVEGTSYFASAVVC